MAYFPEKVTLDPATPASDVHTFNGNVVFGTTGIPSFSSATSRYFGNKSAALTMSLGSTSSGGGFNLYINSYFDGTNNRFTIANETAGRITTAGQTAAANGFYFLQANNNVSHAADATFSFTTVHSVNSNGLHTIGTSSNNDNLVHQLNGSLNLLGAVIPSYSSTRYRYIGNKLSSSLYDNGSGSAAGGTVMYGNVYFDGTGTKRSRANETCSSVSVGGATSATTAVFAVSADNSVSSAADSSVTLTSLLTIDSNGAHAIGNASSNNSQIQQIYGSVNLIGTAIPSFSSSTVRYVGNKIAAVQFLTGAASTTGVMNAYANCYFDGTNTKFTIANETGVRLAIAGGTAATNLVYALSADSNVSHAADANMSLVTLHSIDANGLHSIGNNSNNNSLVHNINGSLLISGNAIPSFSSADYRYVGTKMSSAMMFKTTTSAGIYITYANGYFDGTNNKRTRANETTTRININGTTTTTASSFSVEADPSVSHAADSNATYTSLFSLTPDGSMTLNASTAVSHVIGGAVRMSTSNNKHVLFGTSAFTSIDPITYVRKQDNTSGAQNTFMEFARGCADATSAGTTCGRLGLDSGGTFSAQNVSDLSLKTDIEDFKDGLKIIKEVAARTFSWKEDESKKRVQGFIAQEIEKYFPLAVSNDKASGLRLMSPTSLIPVLWSALRELLERVEKLEKKKTKKDEE